MQGIDNYHTKLSSMMFVNWLIHDNAKMGGYLHNMRISILIDADN